MFRRFLIVVLIFLIAVVVVADRVGSLVAAHLLAGQVQTDEHLHSRPSASIGGFPFLTQAFAGKYNDVTVTAHDVVLVGGVSVTTLTAHLHGVHLPPSKVVHGSVSRVPVDRVDGTAFVSYPAADAYLSHHLIAGATVSLGPGAGNAVSVVDRLRLGGETFTLHGAGTASVAGNIVTIDVRRLTGTQSAGAGASASALHLASKQLKIALPLVGLPFRVSVRSLSVSSAGVTGALAVRHIVLGGSGD